MNDEERLYMITNQLIIVRDNLFRGMSKSIQKLQAKSINEVLGLDNFIESPKPVWVSLTDEEKHQLNEALNLQGRFPIINAIEAKLKEKNNG